MMKVNADIVVSKNSCIATMVAIARDEKGSFHEVSVLVIESVSSPETAEVVACR